MENTEKPASAGAPITQPRDRWWTRLVSYAKRKVDERTAKKQQESPTDRAARVAATATVWIAFFTFVSVAVSIGTFVILRSQLQEMHDGGVDTHNLAMATKDAADLNRILAEGSAAAWLMPSAQELNRNFLSFGVQNMGGIAAGNVGVSVKVELTRLSNSQTLWTESFTFDTVKYLPPKQNTNGQAVLTISKYTRQDFERIAKEQEALTLNCTATYDNGFKRQVQQKGCVQYLALFKPPEVRAMPQWVGCEAAPHCSGNSKLRANNGPCSRKHRTKIQTRTLPDPNTLDTEDGLSTSSGRVKRDFQNFLVSERGLYGHCGGPEG